MKKAGLIAVLACLVAFSLCGCGSMSGKRTSGLSDTNWGLEVPNAKTPFREFESSIKAQHFLKDRLIEIIGNDGERLVARHTRFDGTSKTVGIPDDIYQKGQTNAVAEDTDDGVILAYTENSDIVVRICAEDLSSCDEGRIVNKVKLTGTPNLTLLRVSGSRFLLLWLSSQRETGIVTASYSDDGGKSWTHESTIENDPESYRVGAMRAVFGEGERLHVVWENWSNTETLVDINYAYSDDFGRTWSQTARINDDRESVWQIDPSIVVSGKRVLVTFEDFREFGAYEDRNQNIYYSVSEDNGETWAQNKRLNRETRGRQMVANLVTASNGDLLCIYASGANTIFTQLAVSRFDPDSNSWTPASFITDSKTRFVQIRPSVSAIGERILVRIPMVRSDRTFGPTYIWLRKGGKPVSAEQKREMLLPVRSEKTRLLMEDDFSGKTPMRWERVHGNWRIEDGAFRGVGTPSSNLSDERLFRAIAGGIDVRNFVFSGRFKLDELSHRSASLFFYSDSRGTFVINNFFRLGSWAEYHSWGDSSLKIEATGILNTGKLKAEHDYSFKAGVWYDFKIVVNQNQADYFVDGNRLFSFKLDEENDRGMIGIGGSLNSPTKFDDIRIEEIE